MTIVALHFWSPTCNPCRVIKPALEDIKEEFPDVQWVSINIQQDTKGVAAQFSVKVVPTVIVLKDNVEVGRHSGSTIITYYSLIRKALSA